MALDTVFTLYPPLEDAHTPDEMRRALLEFSRNDPLVHKVLNAGRHQGLSGEDTYVLLAYNALKERNQYKRLCLEFSETTVFSKTAQPSKD